MLAPDVTGVIIGVGTAEPGVGTLSGAMEYTMIRARDAAGRVSRVTTHVVASLTYSPRRFGQSVELEARLIVRAGSCGQ